MKLDILAFGAHPDDVELGCAATLAKEIANGKKVGIITHQKSSALNTAELNNVLGFKKGTKGADILEEGMNQLSDLYPRVVQIDKEKVVSVKGESPNLIVKIESFSPILSTTPLTKTTSLGMSRS